MFCNMEEFQVELSRKIGLWQIFIGHRSAWFLLLSACNLVEFDMYEFAIRLCIAKAHFYYKICF